MSCPEKRASLQGQPTSSKRAGNPVATAQSTGTEGDGLLSLLPDDNGNATAADKERSFEWPGPRQDRTLWGLTSRPGSLGSRGLWGLILSM